MSRLFNLPSYPLSSNGKDFYFVTDDTVPYEIYLTSGEDYIPDEPFSMLVRMVGFKPLNKASAVQSSADARIHQTIIKALFLYFQEQPDLVVVYVCDMMDGRQRQRSMLFDRWFREFGEGSG